MGVPVTTKANTIQLSGVMEGKHSIDVGMLAIPVLMELIMFMADEEEASSTTPEWKSRLRFKHTYRQGSSSSCKNNQKKKLKRRIDRKPSHYR